MSKRRLFIDGDEFYGYAEIDIEPVEMETIDVDISDDDFLTIAKMAHEKDITFNEMVTIMLEEMIDSGKYTLPAEPECPHENTVHTALYGNYCRDCDTYNLPDKEPEFEERVCNCGDKEDCSNCPEKKENFEQAYMCECRTPIIVSHPFLKGFTCLQCGGAVIYE
jgi:hypothetical protein